MQKEEHIKAADAAFISWGERIAAEMSSGIGYPDASVEGRARRDGIGKADRAMGSSVPRDVYWTHLDKAVNAGVEAMPRLLQAAVKSHYVERLIGNQKGSANREDWRRLRESRVWMSGWLSHFLNNKTY